MEREPKLASIPLTDFNQPLLAPINKITDNYGSGGIPFRTLKQTLPSAFDDRATSIQADDQNTPTEYHSLGDDVRRMYDFLTSLGITRGHIQNARIPEAALFKLYQKEFSSTSWLKWSSLDHVVEKYLQWPLLSPADVGQETQLSCDYRVRPQERSILIKTTWGLMKAYAIRGFVQGLETSLLASVHYFVYAMLTYRLIELLQTGHSDFDEFQAVFSASSQKGIDSLVQTLAHLDAKWLRLFLATPVILGAVQGLLKMRGACFASGERGAILDEIDVTLSQPSSFCQDMSNFLAFSNSVQKLEQWVRWDGRLTTVYRNEVFESICRAARESRIITQLTAMKSLAKIAHGIGFKDLPRLQRAGYSSAELTGLLYIKATALADLEKLAQSGEDNTFISLLPRRVYASYLLWWLGQSTSVWKQQLPFILFKTVKLGLEVLFLQKIAASILEAIRCPDKPGYQFGDGYADWASDYTAACFTTRMSLFRTIDPDESVDDLVTEIPQYHLTGLTNLDLSNKYLTTEEAAQIIQAVIQQGATLKTLNLNSNYINTLNSAMLNGLSQLTTLYLNGNKLRVLNDGVFNGLSRLTTFDLSGNQLGVLNDSAFSGLDKLTDLDLSGNQLTGLSNGVFSGLSHLTILNLNGNQLGVLNDGVFNELNKLTYLDLSGNKLTGLSNGVFSQLNQLTTLYLRGNQLSVLNNGVFSGLDELAYLDLSESQLNVLNEGVFSGLNRLTTLDLDGNQLNVLNDGVFSELDKLTYLDLSGNQLSVLNDGVFSGLSHLNILNLNGNQLSVLSDGVFSELSQLQQLDLGSNDLNTSIIINTLSSMPVTLTALNISSNRISDLPKNFSTLLPVEVKTLLIGNNSFIPSTLTREFMQYFPFRLTEFSIASSFIVNITADSFTDFSRLEVLYLSHNQLSILNRGVFSGLNQLTTLDLGGNQLSVLSDGVFNGLSQLTILALDENQLSVLGDGVFSGLSRLNTLALAGNQLSVLSNDVFSGLNRLNTLVLVGNQLSVLSDGVFSGLSQLTILALDENQLSVLGDGVFSGLSRLNTLALAGNQLSVLSNDVFSGLSRLNILALAGNQLSVLSKGVFSGLSQLAILDLSVNQVNDTAIKNITQNFPYQLNTLLLNKNSIGNKGMQALAEILPCTNLMHIGLAGNPANDASAALAAQQNRLKKFCDDQRCHANLPASESCTVTTGALTAANITWGSGSSIEVVGEDETTIVSPNNFYWPHSAETPAFQSPIALPNSSLAESASSSLTSGEVGAAILGVVSLGILFYKKSTWIPAIINASNCLLQRCWSNERRAAVSSTSLTQSSNRHGLFTSLPGTTQQSSTLAKLPMQSSASR